VRLVRIHAILEDERSNNSRFGGLFWDIKKHINQFYGEGLRAQGVSHRVWTHGWGVPPNDSEIEKFNEARASHSARDKTRNRTKKFGGYSENPALEKQLI
jgi:hypothetical protein